MDHLPSSFQIVLLAQTQLGNDGAVTLDILLLEIVEKVSSLTDHLQQTAAGVMILLVDLHMLGQIVDPLGQDCDLYLGGTGIGVVGTVGGDDRLLLFLEHHSFSPHKVFPAAVTKPGAW